MSKLSTRIAALEGPCRAIDAEIETLRGVQEGTLSWSKEKKKAFFSASDGYMHEYTFKPQPLTSSLDAITQLVEKDLPGAIWELTSESTAGIYAAIDTPYPDIDEIKHKLPAIALCVCYVLAMEANNETDS